jgi:hypothetical protein
MVAALHPPSRFPRRLDGGQQERDQNPNDGDNDEKFYERKCAQWGVANVEGRI